MGIFKKSIRVIRGHTIAAGLFEICENTENGIKPIETGNSLHREKGRDLTQSYDKSPYIDRKIQKATRQHKNATKNFYYTTITQRYRRRTVSWSNDSHPTGVVKPVYVTPTFPLTTIAV